MLIVCPTCASEHSVDPAHIGPDGRKVRCAACRTAWFVAPDHSAPMPEVDSPREVDPFEALMRADAAAARLRDIAEPEPEAEAPARLDPEVPRSTSKRRPRPKKQRRRPLAALGAALRAIPTGVPTLTLCLAAAACFILARPQIVRAAPGTAALYARIGLSVNLRGLDLKRVRSTLETSATEPVLVVEGEVVNVGRGEASVPPLELAVRSAEGQALYTWTSEVSRKTLGPGETSPFRARLAAPPAEGRQVLVRFASGFEGQTVAPEAR